MFSIDQNSQCRLKVEIRNMVVKGYLWKKHDAFWDLVFQLPPAGLVVSMPASGPFAFTSASKCHRIAAWDLEAAQGAVSHQRQRAASSVNRPSRVVSPNSTLSSSFNRSAIASAPLT